MTTTTIDLPKLLPDIATRLVLTVNDAFIVPENPINVKPFYGNDPQ